MPRLRRVDCSSAGIRRVRRGRGFSYQEADGTTIVDREVIERIRELAIPPAWKDVWICPHPNGHIQATGIDAAGRKQYLYHPQWRENRDREKFAEMERFAKALPAMRERTGEDLARRGLVRERVLACAVRLLDLGFFRIGSERYTEENETFGLATLRRKHVRVGRGVASSSTTRRRARAPRPGDRRPGDRADDQGAQGPQRRRLRAARLPRGPQRLGRTCKADRDQRVPEGGHRAATTAPRTSGPGTRPCSPRSSWRPNGHERETKTARKRAATAATKRVAEYLSNTPAVCRSAYIDPRVFDRYDSGETIRGLAAADGRRHASPASSSSASGSSARCCACLKD